MAEVTGVIRVRRVEVEDEDGHVRIVLGASGEADGELRYGVVLRDDAGRERGAFLADREAADVTLNHGGNAVASLSMGYGGVAGMRLYDSDGDAVVEFTNER